jgi:type III restriction enzyme
VRHRQIAARAGADNYADASHPAIYRNLWEHVGHDLLRCRHPLDLPAMLQTALYALYSNYEEYYAEWEKAGIAVPPVFIVVCQNTTISKLVYEWIAGFEREPTDDEAIDETRAFHPGALKLFANYDPNGEPLASPQTILIDSLQLESGDALDAGFRDANAAGIAAFKAQRNRERGAGDTTEPNDADLLREVMNTVGREGRLGEQIRCVVSVSMLTEGWDANTVTHILGIRAFGTQLLCEQVVGRGLRRLDYNLNKDDLLDVEYAQVMGIPFAFTGGAVPAPPTKPKIATHVRALPERAGLEIVFPRVEGFRVELPAENLSASFNEDSRLVLTPREVGPCEVRMEPIVGEGITLTPDAIAAIRPSEISYRLAKEILYSRFRDEDGFPRQHLFPSMQKICKRWLEEGYLVLHDVPIGAVLYRTISATVTDLIASAVHRATGDPSPPRAVLDPYQPTGSTELVNFQTTRPVWRTDPRKSHVSHVVLDSGWEDQLALVLDTDPRVLSYAKNQGMQFEIPYRAGRSVRHYAPDFLVRADLGGEVINLVLEVKGYRGIDDQLKAATMRDLWVPGVNNLGAYGRWAFAEFREPFLMREDFARFLDSLLTMELV